MPSYGSLYTDLYPPETTAGAGGAGAVPPGWPQVIVEAGFAPAAPGLDSTALILDDPVNGKLNTGTLGPSTAWTQLTGYMPDGTAIVQDVTITRGSTRQQGPLITYEAGTATITLCNTDARFSPENLAGPYVSGGETQVRPMVPIRVRATWNGMDYGLFSGYVRSWTPPTAQNGPDYDTVTVQATDAFCVLEGVTIPATGAVGAGELSGARVSRILAAAGWYAVAQGLSDIDAGQSALQATGFGASALDLLRLTADSEVGEIYVNGRGQVTFRDRRAPSADTRSSTVQGTFGDLAGAPAGAGNNWSVTASGTPINGTYFIVTTAQAALISAGDWLTDTLNPGRVFTVVTVGSPFAGFCNITVTPAAAVIMASPDTVTQVPPQLAYTEITRPDDDTTMANDIQATIAGSSAVQEAKDTASIARFLFPRSYSRTDLILQTDADALQWASYVLGISKDDESRFDSLTLQADADPDRLFPHALGRELGDRIRVWRHPPGMAAISKDCFISSVTHTITVDGWVTEWGLRDASKYGSVFTLNDPVLGKLDSNSLAFLRPGGWMPLPVWSSGQVLTASDVDSFFVPLVAEKTSDQSVTSSTTLVNDTQLLITPAVSTAYLFICYLDFEGGTAGASDLKWQWGVPSGTNLRYQGIFMGTGGSAAVNNTYAASDVVAARTQGLGNLSGVSMIGTLVTGSTSGNLQLKWAQNTSSGTATTVHAQSVLTLFRIRS